MKSMRFHSLLVVNAAARLAETEGARANALGEPTSGPPDLEAEAAAVGTAAEEIRVAFGPPPDDR